MAWKSPLKIVLDNSAQLVVCKKKITRDSHLLKFLTITIIYFLVLIDSGPRFEVAYPSGISHFLEKLAFNVSFFS